VELEVCLGFEEKCFWRIPSIGFHLQGHNAPFSSALLKDILWRIDFY
jgi:hypothetical protein